MPTCPSISLHNVRSVTIETENNPATETCHAFNTTRYTFKTAEREEIVITCFHKDGLYVEATHRRQDT